MKKHFCVVSLTVLVSVISLCFGGELTPVEKLSKIIPEDSVGFVSISGMDSVGPAFEKSTMGKVWLDPQVQTMMEAIKEMVVVQIEKESSDPNCAEISKLIMQAGNLICRRPAIAGAAINDTDIKAPFYGYAIIDAGPLKKELNSTFKEIEKLIPDGEIVKKQVGPVRMRAVKLEDGIFVCWGWSKNYFVITINDDEGTVLKNIYWPKNEIAAGLKEIPSAGDALVINYNFSKIMEVIKKTVKIEAPAEYDKMMSIFDDIGISDMKTVSARLGFDRADMVFGEFVDVPEPRKGVFSCFGNVSISQFCFVEPQAMEAATFNMDIAKYYDAVFGAIMKAAPANEAVSMKEELAKFEKESGFKIREGLLESIDGECLYYVMPAGVMMEAPGGGVVAIVKLKNDKLFEDNMTAVGKFVAGKSNNMLQVSSVPKGDLTIHSWTVMPLAMLQIMPCWTVSDGYAVVASNLPLCGKVLDRIGAENPSVGSLIETEKFKGAVKGLPDNLVSISYVDTEVQFRQMLGQLQRFWPMLSMSAMQKGIKLPAMLPTFDEAIKQMKPTASYAWFDEKGIHSRYAGSGVEIGVGAAVGGGIGAAVMMPALGKVKKQALKTASLANLKSIGIGCSIYANDNDGKFPPNLEFLITEADVSPKYLVSPQKPKRFKGPSYIYIDGQSVESNLQNVLAYENTEYLRNSTNVLFIDGHIEKMCKPKFILALNATYERLGREMPEVRFKGDHSHKHVETHPGGQNSCSKNKDKTGAESQDADVSSHSSCAP